MPEIFNCVMTKHAIAFGVGSGIFLLTILLVATRAIGFIMSLVFMLIALGATMAITRPEATEYWNQYTPDSLHIPEHKSESPAPVTPVVPAKPSMPASSASQPSTTPVVPAKP